MNLEVRLRRKDGTLIWAQISASTIELDGVACVLFVTRDISAAKAAEEEIRTLSLYDGLTCLPNRRQLLERLHVCRNSGGEHRKSALLSINLDHFRAVNDALGSALGDLFLQESARRVAQCVRDGDIVARSGGDEFSVVLEHLSETTEEAAAQAQIIAQRILAALSQPLPLAGRDCRCTASIGITVFGGADLTGEEILQQSDIAVDDARMAGRNTMRFFAPALQTAINERLATEADLRTGIERDQLMLFYQPQVRHGQLVGAEALVRWRHPRRGLLLPGEFILLAEETGLIVPLGDWVVEAACRQAALWTRPALAGISIAVNISARQFRQPDFVRKVLDTLIRTGAQPGSIVLELTESLLVDDVDEVVARMSELRAHGLRFSVDDFGVGYSSLSYLKRLPLDTLKIDMSFIRDILVDAGSSAIAQAIISLAHAMGLSVIAEGVESEEQREYLDRLGCHSCQGFLFGPPLPAGEFEERMAGVPVGRL
jgi:diguanylate cyclase (GGDEF)-like protein